MVVQTYVGVAEAVASLHSNQVFRQSTEQLVTRSRCAVVTMSRIVALRKTFIAISDGEEFFLPEPRHWVAVKHAVVS